jgi:hypothetical protein
VVTSSCRLFSIIPAARPDDHREAALVSDDTAQSSHAEQAPSLIEMASSGHMIKEKLDLASKPSPGEDAEDLIEKGLHIADDTGALNGMPKMYTEMSRLFKEAAKKVYDEGDYTDDKKNFIKRTAYDWMNKVQDFKVHAGHLRKHADEIYQEIVRAHVGAGKEINDAFADEMRKLELMHKGQTEMQQAVQQAETTLGAAPTMQAARGSTAGSGIDSTLGPTAGQQLNPELAAALKTGIKGAIGTGPAVMTELAGGKASFALTAANGVTITMKASSTLGKVTCAEWQAADNCDKAGMKNNAGTVGQAAFLNEAERLKRSAEGQASAAKSVFELCCEPV